MLTPITAHITPHRDVDNRTSRPPQSTTQGSPREHIDRPDGAWRRHCQCRYTWGSSQSARTPTRSQSNDVSDLSTGDRHGRERATVGCQVVVAITLGGGVVRTTLRWHVRICSTKRPACPDSRNGVKVQPASRPLGRRRTTSSEARSPTRTPSPFAALWPTRSANALA